MSLSILIVDDDKIDRQAVKRYLSRPGIGAVFCEAETAREAIGHLEERKFDCVFLDYQLPDMDGISLLRRFYNPDTGLTSSPTVMMTGQGSEAVMIDAIRWGAQDYLVKDLLSTDTLNIAMVKAREFFELKKSQKHAEELLRQSQKMEAVGQLTSGIAHDFNNLLTIILGNTRVMQKRLETHNENNQELLKKILAIETAAHKGSDLVKRLMIFTRQRPMELQAINVNEKITNILKLIQSVIGETIQIETVLADDTKAIEIDVSQFENALVNMAVNARDAMPKGGRLVIETKNVVLTDEYTNSRPHISPGLYVSLAVSDTGTGMSRDVASRIFDPFYTTKEAGEGTGLGLSMVYGLIKQAGGFIHVYSEEGFGTTFRIYLPASEQEEVSVPVQAPHGSETVLIVENDEEIKEIGIYILEKLGYKVLHASDGPTALEILKQEENIELIFTDIVLPGINGLELIEEARTMKNFKVLYTSGFSRRTIPDRKLLDSENFIEKPYSLENLAVKLRHVLDEKGQ